MTKVGYMLSCFVTGILAGLTIGDIITGSPYIVNLACTLLGINAIIGFAIKMQTDKLSKILKETLNESDEETGD